jgi:hypothetical protein
MATFRMITSQFCVHGRCQAKRVTSISVKRTIEWLAASLGPLDEVAPRFSAALDLPKGGVLLALPALLVSGLVRDVGQYFRLPKGFSLPQRSSALAEMASKSPTDCATNRIIRLVV